MSMPLHGRTVHSYSNDPLQLPSMVSQYPSRHRRSCPEVNYKLNGQEYLFQLCYSNQSTMVCTYFVRSESLSRAVLSVAAVGSHEYTFPLLYLACEEPPSFLPIFPSTNLFTLGIISSAHTIKQTQTYLLLLPISYFYLTLLLLPLNLSQDELLHATARSQPGW